MISRKDKDRIIGDLRVRFGESTVAIFANNNGVNVANMTKLRTRMRENGCVLKVAKNTLAIKVAKELGYDNLEQYLSGPTVIAFSSGDLVAPAKVFFNFIKETKAPLEIKAGMLEGKVIDAKGAKALAELPSREVLLGKILGNMQTPMYGFATVLNGSLRNFVYALDAVRQQKAEESA
ncbi:MAG: 50S ribosomal protein L10 [Peptococcaceae bacterium]|nr:50S ribosomal protein L10 [Peptococcaceae bacterium]